KNPKKSPAILRWGPITLPDGEAHFCVVGSPGSGKTLTMSYLMQSVFEQYHKPENTNYRVLVYDAKGDAYSILRSFGVKDDEILFLNPFDQRASAWDIAKDVQTEGVAQEIVEILLPDSGKETNPFFTKAARDLFTAVLVSLHDRAPNNWTLRDA